jgi:hypothetical protein
MRRRQLVHRAGAVRTILLGWLCLWMLAR